MTLRRLLAGLSSLTALWLGGHGAALAQALERYPPLTSPSLENDRPIGPPLQAIILRQDGHEFTRQPATVSIFAGQLMSPRLIDRIEADIKAQLDTPEHPVSVRRATDRDIGDGTLVLDVTPAVSGAPPPPPARRRWDAYTGYRYSGTRDLNLRRFYAGGAVRDLGRRGSELAFITTLSPDRVLHAARHPKFNEAVVTYTAPVSSRTTFETSLDLIELNFQLNPSIYRFTDVMTAAGLRYKLADGGDGAHRDLRAGIEAKNEQLTLLTSGAIVSRQSSEVYQLYAGYHAGRDKGGIHEDLDVILRLSPGGLDAGNTSAQHNVYSMGRVSSARYAYAYLTYDRRTRLNDHVDWHSHVAGELATSALPFSEQPALGGNSLVRGYHFIDGSFDDVLIVRNEMVLRRKSGRPGPFVFWDIGTGRDKGLKTTDLLESVGFGGQVELTAHATLEFNAIHTLRPGQFTTAGTDEVGAHLMITF